MDKGCESDKDSSKRSDDRKTRGSRSSTSIAKQSRSVASGSDNVSLSSSANEISNLTSSRSSCNSSCISRSTFANSDLEEVNDEDSREALPVQYDATPRCASTSGNNIASGDAIGIMIDTMNSGRGNRMLAIDPSATVGDLIHNICLILSIWPSMLAVIYKGQRLDTAPSSSPIGSLGMVNGSIVRVIPTMRTGGGGSIPSYLSNAQIKTRLDYIEYLCGLEQSLEEAAISMKATCSDSTESTTVSSTQSTYTGLTRGSSSLSAADLQAENERMRKRMESVRLLRAMELKRKADRRRCYSAPGSATSLDIANSITGNCNNDDSNSNRKDVNMVCGQMGNTAVIANETDPASVPVPTSSDKTTKK